MKLLCESTLTLLVFRSVADNHDATLATNNFALIANLLHAWLNFHDCPPLFTTSFGVCRSKLLLVAIDNATSCKVIRTQLHDHAIGREDSDVVLPHLPADVSQDLVPVC
jgi:hypothetical protein